MHARNNSLIPALCAIIADLQSNSCRDSIALSASASKLCFPISRLRGGIEVGKTNLRGDKSPAHPVFPDFHRGVSFRELTSCLIQGLKAKCCSEAAQRYCRGQTPESRNNRIVVCSLCLLFMFQFANTFML